MSTFAYAALTTTRDQATETSPTGIPAYVDAMAALVPAEILGLHAMILSVTTTTTTDATGEVTTTITEASTLQGAFWGLAALSVVLFVVPRIKVWTRSDYFRMFIPPLAFVVWCMLQKTTAFDAVQSGLAEAPRTVIALFAAVVLGVFAGSLAMKAERTGTVPLTDTQTPSSHPVGSS